MFAALHSSRSFAISSREIRPAKYSSTVGMRFHGWTGARPSESFPFVKPASAMPIMPVTTPRWKPSRDFSATRASFSTQLARRRLT